MNIYLDCMPCFVRHTLDSVRKMSEDAAVHEQIVRDVLRMAADMDLQRSPPQMAQAVHRRLRELTGIDDAFAEEKAHFNRLALAALPELRAAAIRAEDPLFAAATFAVAANAIDLGVASELPDAEVLAALRSVTTLENIHGDFARFHAAAGRAQDILYLADNAGEIAVDRLVVELLGPERVTVAVRGAPVLNDATLVDAREVGLCELTRVIENGSDAPGTILEDCSAAFRARFERADLVIAKGQGNFETLSGTSPKVAFWFKVKCPVIARHVGLPLHTFALLPPGA